MKNPPGEKVPYLKVCCIASVDEAKLAISQGAFAIGLVGKMPSGPGIIDDSTIRLISDSVRSQVHTFLLTAETSAQGIIEHHTRTQTSHIQMVSPVAKEEYAKIRSALKGVSLVQVIHVEDEWALDEAMAADRLADYLLLDSGKTKLATPQLGGTGRTHDWGISARIVEAVEKPVFLAGGLRPENAKAAIQQVGPFGLDICNGLRDNTILKEEKLKALKEALSGS